jgi:TRAP-type C4-dicarboxylate transport system substrate-binding protein
MHRIVLAILCALSVPAWAQDKIVLKVADTLPTTHYMSIQGAKFFMSRATELTQGRVQFEYYPSEQLGKGRDMLKLATSGVADITYVAPGYVSEKFPLAGVAELPGYFSSSCQGTKGFYALAHGGILDKQEYRPNGVIALMAWNLGSYQLNTRSVKLHALSDFKGLKMRGAGGTWDIILRTLGANPVNFPAPEMREALERGTIDGTVSPAISLKPYDLLSIIRYMTRDASFGSFASTYSMNLRKFRALPPDIQAALDQAGREATLHLCAYVDANEESSFDEAEKAGISFWRLNGAEQAQLRETLAPVGQEWAKALDARHLPGTQVLNDFAAAMK